MKNVLSVVAFLALGACGVAKNQAADLSDVVTGNNIQGLFVSDKRLVDGVRNQISVHQDKVKGYNLTRTITFPRSQDGAKTVELLNNATCKKEFLGRSMIVSKLNCSFDGRMVDGPLVEVIFSLNGDDGKYDAEKIVTPSGMGGSTEPIVTDLGIGLEFQPVLTK